MCIRVSAYMNELHVSVYVYMCMCTHMFVFMYMGVYTNNKLVRISYHCAVRCIQCMRIQVYIHMPLHLNIIHI